MSENTEKNPIVNDDEDKDNMISKLISEKKMIKERNVRLASLLNIVTKKISDTNNASSNINISGLSGIEDNITLLKKQISGIERMFEKSTVDSKVDDLNKAMSDLNSRVESIEGSLSPVHRLEGIENKLSDVESLIRLHKRTGDNPFGMLGNVGSKDISDMYKDVEKPKLSEDIIKPNNPKTEAEPKVPDDEVKSDVPEDTTKEDTPETEAEPKVPDDEAKSDAPEDTAAQDTPETEAEPKVPDNEAKSDVPEDTTKEDTPETETDLEEVDSVDKLKDIIDKHPKHEHHIGFGMLKNILNYHTSDSKNKQKTSQIKPELPTSKSQSQSQKIKPEPSAPKSQSVTPKDKPEPNTHKSGTSLKYDSVFSNKKKKQAKDKLKKKTSSETKIKASTKKINHSKHVKSSK
ncbi:hypothetical protein GQ472_05585 [archaeon]|nr:hypothetical protein [archaeon]